MTMMKLIVVCTTLLLGTLSDINCCQLHDFVDLGIMERFIQSDYVVYGETINHVARKVTTTDRPYYAIDALFEVDCVLKKGDDIVTEQITVLDLSPRDQCSGTPVTKLLRVGDHAILALQNEGVNRFSLQEVSPSLSAAVRAYKPYFFSFARLCHLQSWEAPFGATTLRCPVCGVSDFLSDVEALDNTDNSVAVCASTGSYIINENMTSACDIYMKYTLEEANNMACVPSDYKGACALLVPRTTSATCDCTVKKDKTVNVGAGEMVIPNVILITSLFILSL